MEFKLSNPFLIKVIVIIILLISVLIIYALSLNNLPPIATQPTPIPSITAKPTMPIISSPIPTTKPTSELTPVPTTNTSDWKNYRNEEYGFELTFPLSWKGYITETKKLELNSIGKYDSINFGFDIQNSLFNINIFTKDQWEKVVAAEIESGRPKPDYISENEKFIFNLQAAQYTENQEMADRMSEIENIISTFKFIK